MRLFLDANVLFTAAHNPTGKAALVLELGAKGAWEVISSTYAAEEARRNIAIKFPVAQARLEKLLEPVRLVVSGTGTECMLALPDKDRPIMESAMHAGATHLLTGDIRDFGPFMNKPKKTSGIVIQTVAEFLAAL